MKTCSAPNCTRFCFGGGFCKSHQYLRTDKGTKPSQNQSSEPRSRKNDTIHRRTPKRASDERYYAVQAKEFFDDAVLNGTNHCVFCGEKVTKFEGLHHWKGRTNQYLLDKRWWSTVHNDCHLFYHRATVEQMREMAWYNDWLNRLKLIDITLYGKEINKAQKGILFSEDLEILK